MNKFEIEGTLKGFLQQVSGNGQNGPWYKQEVIFTIPGEYQNDICIEFWNEKITELLTGVVQGQKYKVAVNIQSNTRDNVKYYTSLRAWKIEGVQAAAASVQPAQPAQYAQPAQPAAPAQPSYKLGDVVNGYILTPAGWVSHTPAPAPVQQFNPSAAPAQVAHPQFAAPAAPAQTFNPIPQQQQPQQAAKPQSWDAAEFAPRVGDVPF